MLVRARSEDRRPPTDFSSTPHSALVSHIPPATILFKRLLTKSHQVIATSGSGEFIIVLIRRGDHYEAVIEEQAIFLAEYTKLMSTWSLEHEFRATYALSICCLATDG